MTVNFLASNLSLKCYGSSHSWLV